MHKEREIDGILTFSWGLINFCWGAKWLGANQLGGKMTGFPLSFVSLFGEMNQV